MMSESPSSVSDARAEDDTQSVSSLTSDMQLDFESLPHRQQDQAIIQFFHSEPFLQGHADMSTEEEDETEPSHQVP